MNGYKCFYNDKELDVWADTTLEAQEKAAKLFKAKKSWKVHVRLCELNGKQVIHIPSE